jgi:hypothetical protein
MTVSLASSTSYSPVSHSLPNLPLITPWPKDFLGTICHDRNIISLLRTILLLFQSPVVPIPTHDLYWLSKFGTTSPHCSHLIMITKRDCLVLTTTYIYLSIPIYPILISYALSSHLIKPTFYLFVRLCAAKVSPNVLIGNMNMNGFTENSPQ